MIKDLIVPLLYILRQQLWFNASTVSVLGQKVGWVGLATINAFASP